MKAATVQKKNPNVRKGKLKKTIKNILCRPDTVFWPEVSEEESKSVDGLLEKHKVTSIKQIKPHWDVLKLMSKEQRREYNKIVKVKGIKFGHKECCRELESKKELFIVVVDSDINPQMLVHPLLNQCLKAHISAICVKGLKEMTERYFGIPSTCIRVFNDVIPSLYDELNKIAIKYNATIKREQTPENIEVAATAAVSRKIEKQPQNDCPYLYRNNTKCRVFIPDGQIKKEKEDFSGQNYIKLAPSQKNKQVKRKQYMNMILKKVTSNANR